MYLVKLEFDARPGYWTLAGSHTNPELYALVTLREGTFPVGHPLRLPLSLEADICLHAVIYDKN